MTAGVVYLRIPDSESLLALLVLRAREAVPTAQDINAFYRSVNGEFLRAPFFKKKKKGRKKERKKKKKSSSLPFPLHFVCRALSAACCRALLMSREALRGAPGPTRGEVLTGAQPSTCRCAGLSRAPCGRMKGPASACPLVPLQGLHLGVYDVFCALSWGR